MNKFIIGQELAQEILNYLQTKPYVEVAKLIDGLIRLERSPSIGEQIIPQTEEK